MAKFELAYRKTLYHEGGYSNDPKDRGGETYRGISRRYHPGWPGWPILDSKKEQSNFPACLGDDEALNKLVGKFYKNHFWDRFLGDEIESHALAEELFDTAVNMGVKRGTLLKK